MTGQGADKDKVTQETGHGGQHDANSNKRNKWRNNKNGPSTKHQSGKGAFKGAIAALNGNVYEVHNEAFKANQFQKTTKAIAAYVNRTMKHGNDMRYIIENLAEVDFDALIPVEPSTGSQKVNEMMLQQAISLFMKRKDLYETNKNALYTIVWEQCSEALQAKLEGTDQYQEYAPISCPIGLLKHIKQASLQFENVTYTPAAVDDAKVALYSFHQSKQDTLHQYYLKFKDLCDALDHYGADVGYDVSLVRDIASRNGDKDADDITTNHPSYQSYKAAARERYLAFRFLRGADRSKYSDLVIDLENDYSKGGDYFPSTVAAAYTLLKRYKKGHQGRQTTRSGGQDDGSKNKDGNDNDNHGVVFVNKDGKQIGKDVSCFDCGGNHYRGDPSCPKHSKLNEDDEYTAFPSVAFVGAHPAHLVDRNWLLLDNQSSVHIFKNASLVSNITTLPHKQGLLIHSNGGSQFTNQIATHPHLGRVWFNPNAITNIISFSKCRRAGMHLAYNYDPDIFTLTCPDGHTYQFTHVDEDLYACDLSSRPAITKAVCASTVSELQRSFTPRQVAKADKARALYRLLGRPSDRVFKHMLSHNLIKNTDVTVEDVTRATRIYGPEMGCLKGKTVRTTPESVKLPPIIPLPDDIKRLHSNVVLCVDVCHVDGLRFLTSISRDIHFATVEFVPSTDHPSIVASIKNIINIYHSRGFRITWVLTDRAFEHLRPVMTSLNIRLNVTSANEHVPEIERFIRVIKERIRGFITTYPVPELPNVMKIHLIQHIVQMLNLTIQPNGISDLYSPATIVIGSQLDTQVYCRLEFGTYCQVHEDTNPRNDVHAPRTIDAISLRPIGNAQGGYYFLCLSTWRVIARRSWTILPMPQHVHELLLTKSRDECSNRPSYLRHDNFHFRHLDRSTLTSLADDDNHLLLYPFVHEGATPLSATDSLSNVSAPALSEYRLDTDDDDHDTDDNDEVDIDDDNVGDDDSVSADDEERTNGDAEADELSNNEDELLNNEDMDDTNPNDEDEQLSNDEDELLNNEDMDANNPDDADEQSNKDDEDERSNGDDDDTNNITRPLIPDAPPINSLEAVIQSTSNYSSHPQRDPSAKDSINPEITESNIIPTEPDRRISTQRYSMRAPVLPTYAQGGFNLAIACTQMTAKEGLKRFGKDAEDALLVEWKQLDNLKVYNGVYYKSLSPQERARVLRLVQLIKLKRCGKLKGRTCADGRKQRTYIPADEAASPTVSTEALMMSLVVDAKERRKVVTADVPGAFLHAKMDDVVHVVVEGEQLEILLKSNPAYKMYVHRDHRTNKDKLYLRLNKALYGTLKAARLFYDDLTSNLQDMGFVANPYDPCVMNKNIMGSQCTIAWHVDDIKISHKRQDVIEDVLKKLESVYGELSVTRGNKHTFVGMDFEIDRGAVKVSMQPYLHEALEAFPDDTTKKVTTPAADHLYTVNPNAKKLPEKLRECFHHIVAKLLFVATRARPDLQPTISFLTSRCAKADVDDWKKLKRLLCYIRHTIDLKLTLRANAMNIVMWWADAAFAVRDDFKSQSGRGMSLGTGMIQCKSHKQSTTENSSTTAEVIASSDALIMIIWTNNFLKAQGYPIKDTILFQDNMSAIKLEQNGRQSSSKRTRHLNIRHFFIKDRVQSGELNIKHCGTDDMIADYFTKPLQGSKFIQFRDLILGIKDIDSTSQIRSVLEKDLKWPNLNNQIGDDKRPSGEPLEKQNYERMKRVSFSDSS